MLGLGGLLVDESVGEPVVVLRDDVRLEEERRGDGEGTDNTSNEDNDKSLDIHIY